MQLARLAAPDKYVPDTKITKEGRFWIFSDAFFGRRRFLFAQRADRFGEQAIAGGLYLPPAWSPGLDGPENFPIFWPVKTVK